MSKNGTLLSIAAFVLLAGGSGAFAQNAGSVGDYPRRPIRVVVPFSPGGQPDIYMRLLLPKLVEAFKTQIIVDNRAGAGGSIGTKIVHDSAPDGYTLLTVSSGHTINPFLYKLPYDSLRDFSAITRTYSAPYLLVGSPSLSAKNAGELIALAKAKPGQLNFGSAGLGSGTHFAAEMFKYAAKIDVVHVPYRGIPETLTDLIGGRVQFFMAPIGSASPLVRDGKLKGLGVSSIKRSPALPNIPAIAESGLPGFEWDAWGSFLAPSKTPRAIIDLWNREVSRAVTAPDIQKKLNSIGMLAEPTSPRETDDMIKKQMAVVENLVKTAKIRRD